MRVYKAKDSGKESRTWYADFFLPSGRRCRLALFVSKRTSEAFAQKITELCGLPTAGISPDAELQRWLDGLPLKFQDKFIKWGLIDSRRIEGQRPVSEHVSDYIESIEGFSSGYIGHVKNYLKKIMADCRFYYFRDITKSAVETYLGKLKKDGFNNTTRGHYLDSLKTFLNWAEQDRRITNNPIDKIEKPARDSKKKGVLTPEQFVQLIRTTFEKNILIGKLTGQDRAVLYMLGGVTGIRRKELLNLIWDDINLGDNAYVRVPASLAKNHKEAQQLIPPAMVFILTALKASTRPTGTDRVFVGIRRSIDTAELIKGDLTAAGIPLKDRDGNKIYFHSLRNSYISFLANSQTPAKIIMQLARHSDFKLTFNTYARAFEKAEKKAINCLPNFGDFVLATSLDSNRIKQEIFIDNGRHQNSNYELETAFLPKKEIGARGLEPPTFGPPVQRASQTALRPE